MNTPNNAHAKKFHRIGILGGTFDPIHNGHIIPAIATAKWLQLETLHLLPAHIPPHKNSTTASPKQRMQMVNIVCQQQPLFSLDGRELLRNQPSYTVDTLKEFKQEHPNSQLFFVMGMDSLLTFTEWHQWQEILRLCHLVVNIRPGYPLSDRMETLASPLKTNLVHSLDDLATLEYGKIIIHQQPTQDISSTQLRVEIANNIFDDNKIPPEIIDYIQQQKLYQN